ncbi:MAG: diguanylate cyclase [Methylococcales bacterium]|nr:diguanylate cyclase [Methylococcales bacterium]
MNEFQYIHVLLVEDEIGDAHLVKSALKKNKEITFDVTWVESLSLAIQALSENDFDVMLLDLSLSDSDGLKTVEIARKMAGNLPIVVLTGRSDTDFALTALKAGANDYMVKGDCGFDGLTRVIRYTLLRVEMETHNKLLVAALNAAANAIVITNKDGYIKWINPAFSRLTGYSEQESLGKRPSDLVKSGVQDLRFYQEMWEKLLAGEHWRGEIINKHKDGELYHEELSIAPVKNSVGDIVNFIGIKEDISERKALEEKLQKLANTDSLTGLFNRRVFLERLKQESERIVRLGGFAALLMLDLDFFKQINDTYGHATGDEALRQFSKIVRNHSRSIDVPARLGGEEFAILLPSTNQHDAEVVAERLCQEVSEIAIEHSKGIVKMTVSIGGALISADNSDGELALSHADNALYHAKKTGRNKICWFEE